MSFNNLSALDTREIGLPDGEDAGQSGLITHLKGMIKMKHWLALAALICFGSNAAQAAVEIYSVPYSSYTYKTVSVSTSTPTPLFVGTLGGTTTDFYDIMKSRRELEVQNVDGSSTTFAACVVDVSSSLAAGYLSANQIEYAVHPGSSPFAGSALPPSGLNPTFTWKPAVALQDNNNHWFVPWCLCYGVGKSASACNLEVIQKGSN